MDEQRLRSVLTDLADGGPALPVPDPAHVFDRARRLRARANHVAMVSAAVAIVLVGATVAGVLLIRPDHGGPLAVSPAGPTTATRTTGQTFVYSEPLNPTMTNRPSGNLSPTVTSVSPVPKPSQPTNEGPFCGWSTTLPGTVQQLLPHIGTWTAPLQVAGICGPSLGVRMNVTVGAATGTVMVVMSKDTGTAKQGACAGTGVYCAQTAHGYVGWVDRPGTSGAQGFPGLPTAEARYQGNDGLLVDITGINQALDGMENPAAGPAQPAMAASPYDAQVLAVLAERLGGMNWQLQDQH